MFSHVVTWLIFNTQLEACLNDANMIFLTWYTKILASIDVFFFIFFMRYVFLNDFNYLMIDDRLIFVCMYILQCYESNVSMVCLRL